MFIDQERIIQIVVNLVTNAIKYTSKGSITIKIDWLPGDGTVTRESFEPIPYDTDGEGVFEKDENISSFLGQARLQHNYIVSGIEEHPNGCSGLIGKGLLKVTVRDPGCGMVPEQLDRLFSR